MELKVLKLISLGNKNFSFKLENFEFGSKYKYLYFFTFENFKWNFKYNFK
jgi:hypothetical protein